MPQRALVPDTAACAYRERWRREYNDVNHTQLCELHCNDDIVAQRCFVLAASVSLALHACGQCFVESPRRYRNGAIATALSLHRSSSMRHSSSVSSFMKLLTAAIGGACLTLAAQASAVTFATGDARAVAEPAVPTLCQPALKASQTPDGRLFEAALESAPPDTRTIQAALTACKNGAVLLTSGSGNAFLTGPLTIPAGVTLVVDQGVTVYGSRNPADYGSGCGTAVPRAAVACR